MLNFKNLGRSGGLYIAIFLRRVQKGFPLQSLTQNLVNLKTFQ